MEEKKIWASKTLYLNLLAIVAIIVQYTTGQELLGAEAQVAILAVINLILRMVTGKPIKW